MEINKKSRTELKAYFIKNAIPTESNFRDLIDASLSHKDDGLTKSAGSPLSIEAATSSDRPVLHLYESFVGQAPNFVVSLLPGTTSGTSTTGRGLGVGDGAGAARARLFIEEGTGNIGIGTVDPGGYKANVAGTLNVTGLVTAKAGISVTGALTATGAIQASGALSASTATVSGDLKVNGTATLATLSTTASAGVSGALSVTGGTLLSTLGTSGNTSVGGTLSVTGNTSLSTLGTSGNTSVGGALAVVGNTSLSTLGTSGNTSVGGVLSVSGATALNGGATLAGLTVTSADLYLDNAARRGTRPNNGRYALSHLGGDSLGLNWGERYTGGIKLHGQTQLTSRLALYGNQLLLGAFGGRAGGLGYFSSSRPFAGAFVNGPVLFGSSGGALGTITKPLSASSANLPIEGALVLGGGTSATGGGHVTLPALSDTFSGGLSIEAWVYISSLSSSWARIVDLGNTSGGSGSDNIILGQQGSTSNLYFAVHRGSSNVQFSLIAANALTTGTWMHLCATLDASGSAKLYKDGVLLTAAVTGSVGLPNVVTRTSNFIGRSNWSVDHFLAAKVAHVKLWARPLSADEILDSATDVREVNTTSLIGHWALDEATGVTARDRSSLGRHGTLSATGATFETYQVPALAWDSSGNVSLPGRLSTTGQITAAGGINATGQILAPAGISATGQITAAGGINATGQILAPAGINATGQITAAGGINATGQILAPAGISASGPITASGGISATGPLTASGGLVISSAVTTTNANGAITIAAPLMGPVNDYAKAQYTLMGGGKVTWGGPGGRLKWTQRFIAISAETSSTLSEGYVDIGPSGNAPSVIVDWDGSARSSTTEGVLLNGWEALYAVHTIGGNRNAVQLRVVYYQRSFKAPSNWILVAVVNQDEGIVKLGTGQTVAARSSVFRGALVPSGSVIMWYGASDAIPDGWVLCNGSNGTPNLTDRFVVGAGSTYALGATGGQSTVTLTSDQMPSHTHSARAGGWDDKNFSGSNMTSGGQRVQFTRSDAGNDNNWNTEYVDYTGGGQAHENKPPYYALFYIMKL